MGTAESRARGLFGCIFGRKSRFYAALSPSVDDRFAFDCWISVVFYFLFFGGKLVFLLCNYDVPQHSLLRRSSLLLFLALKLIDMVWRMLHGIPGATLGFAEWCVSVCFLKNEAAFQLFNL